MEIKKKIAVWCALFALLAALVPPSSAKANTTVESGVNNYIEQLGNNLPSIEVEDGRSYILYLYNGKYYYVGFYNLGAVYVNESGRLMCASNGASSVVYYIKDVLTDYTDSSWEKCNSFASSTLTTQFGTVLYSDVYIYTLGYNAVHYESDVVYNEPSIPSAIKEGAETVVMAKFSPMAKSNAGKYCLLVSGAPEVILRTSDRALVFANDGAYVGDVEVWLVGDSGEFELAYSNEVGYCGNDLDGYGLEYAPKVVYTNKPVYLQDDSASVIMASSELYCDVSEDAYITPIVTPTPTPTNAPSTGVQNQTLYMYSVEYTGSVVSAYASLYEVCNGTDDDILVDLLKGMRVKVHGWTTDANGDMWYYCTYTNIYEDEVTGEFTGFIKSNSIDLTYSSGDTDEEQDMTLKEQLQVISSFVLSVPMIISALFTFMPAWSLTLVGIAFSISAILMLRKG